MGCGGGYGGALMILLPTCKAVCALLSTNRDPLHTSRDDNLIIGGGSFFKEPFGPYKLLAFVLIWIAGVSN